MNAPQPSASQDAGNRDEPDLASSAPVAPPTPPAVRVPAGFAPQSPRAKAALCYTVPLVPAAYLLVHEPRDRFVRVHAAQSLVFHGLIGAAQMVLFGAVIFLGGVIQSMAGALIAAAVLFALFAALVIVVAITWAHLVADCIRGRVALLPLVGEWALWVEALTAREVWAHFRSHRAPPGRNAPLSDRPPPEG